MACKLKEAIVEIEKLINSEAYKKHKDNLIEAKKLAEQLMADKKSSGPDTQLKQDSGTIVEQDKVINETLKMKTYGPVNIDTTTGYSEYTKMMQKLVQDIVKPLVKKNQILVLNTVAKGLEGLVAGVYNRKEHTIEIAVKPSRNLIDVKAKELVNTAYYEVIEGLVLPKDKTLQDYMQTDPMYKEFSKQTKDIADKLEKLVEDTLKNKPVHTTLHEYVHAGAAIYMQNNPNSAVTKRINEMYEIAMKPENQRKIDKHFVNVTEQDMNYWKTNVDEFIAEALSNPMLMAGLNEIEVKGKDKLSNLLKELVDILMRMVGLTNKSTVYEYTMDGFAAMIEEQLKANELEKQAPGYVKASATKIIKVTDNLTKIGKETLLKQQKEMEQEALDAIPDEGCK